MTPDDQQKLRLFLAAASIPEIVDGRCEVMMTDEEIEALRSGLESTMEQRRTGKRRSVVFEFHHRAPEHSLDSARL